jgi:tRNA pseudouridine55 synthase
MSVRMGFLIIDKPVGLTSHDIVGMIRAVTGIKKVGHTGTLDPFATGVLPLAIGANCTRLIQYLDEDIKVYDATIALGSSTDTGDHTGTVETETPVPSIDAAMVDAVLAGFAGDRLQVPPRYSAVKVKGKALYKYAREGKAVEVAARPIRIDEIRRVEMAPPSLRVRIQCGRGTYARVLANDIAVELGTVGHLSALRRERSGIFTDDRALGMTALSQMVAGRDDWTTVLRPKRGEERVPWESKEAVWAALQPFLWTPTQVLGHLPVLSLSSGQRDVLLRGGVAPSAPSEIAVGDLFLAVDQGHALAIVRREASGSRVARMIAAR